MKDTLKPDILPMFQTYLNMPWENKTFYAEYLAQTYFYTFHSTRMLALAAARTNTNQFDYYRRSIEHIAEESGHENLALTDLKRLGCKIEDYSELPTTRAFWQPQYFLVDRTTTTLLGYILALEWLAAETFPAVYERVKTIYGDKCVNFIRVHAEEDPDHLDKCFEQIEALSEHERLLALENFRQTCRMFELFMRECAEVSNAHSYLPQSTTLEASP
jgi:thiaminase